MTPEIIVETLVAGIPEIGAVGQTQLIQKRVQICVTCLDMAVGNIVHVEGGLDLLKAEGLHLEQRVPQMAEAVDAGDCESRQPAECIDHVSLHGTLGEYDRRSDRSPKVRPALRSAAVSFFRT